MATLFCRIKTCLYRIAGEEEAMKKMISFVYAFLLLSLLFAETVDKNHIHKWKRVDGENYQCLVCGEVQAA